MQTSGQSTLLLNRCEGLGQPCSWAIPAHNSGLSCLMDIAAALLWGGELQIRPSGHLNDLQWAGAAMVSLMAAG